MCTVLIGAARRPARVRGSVRGLVRRPRHDSTARASAVEVEVELDAARASLVAVEREPTEDGDVLRRARVSLWFEERCPVRSLAGFDRRFHRVPERKTESSDRFVAAVGQEDLERRLARISAGLREHLQLRRRQLRRCEQHLITPEFEFGLSLETDPEDPRAALFLGELTHIREPARVRWDALARVLGDEATRLTVALGEGAGSRELELDLEGLIDACEERGIQVRYPEDCHEATLLVPALGQVVTLRCTPRALELRAPGAASSVGLVEAFTAAATQLAQAGVSILPSR